MALHLVSVLHYFKSMGVLDIIQINLYFMEMVKLGQIILSL